jgi:hypothetical protein
MADRYYYVFTKDCKKYFYSRESGLKVPRKNIDPRIIAHIKPKPEKDISTKKAIDLLERKVALQAKLTKINNELSDLGVHTKEDENDVRAHWAKINNNNNNNNNAVPPKKTSPNTNTKPSDDSDTFDYQQFANNYNTKNKTNYTAEHWKAQFNDPPKPDTSYSNTHHKSSYSYNSGSSNNNSPPTKSQNTSHSTQHYNTYASGKYNAYNKPNTNNTNTTNTNASSSTNASNYTPSPPISPEMSNPASQCRSTSNFPFNTLVSRNIMTKDDWKQWLKKNHTDKGGDATICGYVIAAGRSKGW